MSDYDYHYWFGRFLDDVNQAELELRNECSCNVGSGDNGDNAAEVAENFRKMFEKSGYSARVKSVKYSDSCKTNYYVVVECKYQYHFDRLNQEMYALLDTRTGKIVQFDRGSHKEYAIFATPEDANGINGRLSDEVLEKFGREYIRVITLKMDKDITP